MGTFGQGTFFTERDGTQRPSTLKDIEKILIVGDALENIDRAGGGVAARDMPAASSRIRTYEVRLNNSTGPASFGGSNGRSVKLGMKLAAVLLGGEEELRKKPIVRGGGWANSPLSHDHNIIDSQIIAAENGFSGSCGSMATSGSTAPIELAGTLAVDNAEVLSALVLHQMIAPGAPFSINCSGSCSDNRKGYYPVGNPEMALINAGAMELAHYYNLPSTVAGC